MKIEFSSQDSTVEVTVPAAHKAMGNASTANVASERHRIAVSFLSTADHVALSIKPTVIAQEERQERLTRTIKLGFPPVSISTKG
jgi:ABC-type Fe3+-citrate transport system substrate-binding protein